MLVPCVEPVRDAPLISGRSYTIIRRAQYKLSRIPGEHLRLATHGTFREFVEGHGIESFDVDGNPSELMVKDLLGLSLAPRLRVSVEVNERLYLRWSSGKEFLPWTAYFLKAALHALLTNIIRCSIPHARINERYNMTSAPHPNKTPFQPEGTKKYISDPNKIRHPFLQVPTSNYTPRCQKPACSQPTDPPK